MARLGLPGLLLCLAAAPAAADCLEFGTPGLALEQGVLRGLPPGEVTWRSARRMSGGGHADTLVELRWRLRGAESSQILFAAMQDGRPRLRRDGARVVLDVTYCPRGAEACREVALTYAWDPAQERYIGANPAAREALAARCGAAGSGSN